jgi:hypothetical protein
MSRKATTSARVTRWSAASVPTTNRAVPRSVGSEDAVTSRASTPVSADSSSVARVTPIRSALRRVESHRAHTAGRASPHRRHCSPTPSGFWAMAPPHRVHVARVPHRAQARSRARPVRFRMHTARPSGRSRVTCRRCARRSEKRPVRGSSPVRSTISTTGQPRRSTERAVVTRVRPSAIGTVGQLVTSTTADRSRRPRSTTTSTADQVGARSSR